MDAVPAGRCWRRAAGAVNASPPPDAPALPRSAPWDAEGVPARKSAGILLYRFAGAGAVEVLIGHMGGPFWSRKDAGAWAIPKGESLPGEELADVARREFAEEMGSPAPDGEWLALGELRTSSTKLVTIWAAEGDLDAAAATSNTFEVEWPPRSGRVQQFPEIDRAAWLPVEQAREKLVKGQAPFLDRLLTALETRAGS